MIFIDGSFYGRKLRKTGMSENATKTKQCNNAFSYINNSLSQLLFLTFFFVLKKIFAELLRNSHRCGGAINRRRPF